jgi:CheY-like chemotaxis protein
MRVPVPPHHASVASHIGRRRIIVADDHAPMRRVVAELLRLDGFDVDEVSDGEQLFGHVVRARAQPETSAEVDLIISDVHMPRRSGLDVLRQLRLTRRAIPVVLMTGRSDPSIRDSAEELDATLLEKPFTNTTLLYTVRARLAALAPR